MSAFTNLGRIGDNMIAAVRITAEEGPHPSIEALGRRVAPEAASRSTGTSAVRRCIERGFLEVDPAHEITPKPSDGAVVLTDEGERFISMFTFTDNSNSTTAAGRVK